MRFPALAKSRSTLALLAAAWLPYMLMCCVVAPAVGATPSSEPHCHVLADMLATGAQSEARASADQSHHAHHPGVTADAGKHAMPRSGMPVRTCCDLTGKRHVTVAKAVQVAPPTGIVATLAATVAAPTTSWSERARPLLDVYDHGPPLYLRNTSLRL